MNKEIELINAIVKEAVEHGGDCGGAYFSNEKKLSEAINNWLKYKNLDKDYNITERLIGFDWEYPDLEWEDYAKIQTQADFCQITKKEN